MLITSIMSTEIIHHTLVKKSTTPVRLCRSLMFAPEDMCSYIGITVHFISNYKLHNAMLACR